MSELNHTNGGWTCIEVPCSGQQLETAKLTFSSKGTIYRVTCGPLSNEELARLKRASKSGELVRLAFPKSTVTLSNVTLEQPKAGWAQIEGFVLSTTTNQPPESKHHGERA